MQLYFIKATFTNNVYKISDFFIGTAYKLTATKMLDINFRPDDGLSSFITRQIVLPDSTSVRDHTHVIVPDFNKIYRISSIDYVNVDQYMITLDEDPLIGNYQALQTTDILLSRTNDAGFFKGVNDIADLTLKETVETKVISSTWKTGKWALLFFVYNPDDPVIGLKFNLSQTNSMLSFSSLADVITAYPEVVTTEPEKYSYFQLCVFVSTGTKKYQCVYYDQDTKLRWVEYKSATYSEHYFRTSQAVGAKINKTDVMITCVALPFETVLSQETDGSYPFLSYDQFIGPVDTSIIDIKIISDHLLMKNAITYSLSETLMIKTITFKNGSSRGVATYQEASYQNLTGFKLLCMTAFESDLDISYSSTLNTSPAYYEPFIKYDLYVYGKKYQVPYYLSNSIKLLISVNSGVINYLVYYSDKRNIIASGSFTHSIKYQIDQIDSFYSQNPTYKEQFFTKMAIDSMKGIVGGAVAGSVVPGLGTVAGAGLGFASAAVDAGIGMMNLGFQEKGLRLKPDQSFGENSEVSLQVVNIFGIYWVKRTSDNIALMTKEYDLRGFPTSIYEAITDLTAAAGFLGNTKVVYGELKAVIKNEYVTGFINQKLKEGVVFVV